MRELMVFALTYMALGVLAFVFSCEIASAMNRFSVRFYEVFPALKKAIPLSRLAGSPRNYKSSLYFFRILGALMMLAGTVFLGFVMLHRP